ncbi:MAG: hypothetical protein FWF51_08855 [Chitinivibrionia bacterium]|nr:hypothetical protein [Chitinivibrionia bacterium]
MKKKFDCLKMKEEIQAKIWSEIKELSDGERNLYFRKGAQEFRRKYWKPKIVELAVK